MKTNLTPAQATRLASIHSDDRLSAFQAQRQANRTGRPVTISPRKASDPTARLTFNPAR